MDCQLLERTGRGIAPAAGQQPYYYARSLLDKFRMLEHLRHGEDVQLVSRLHVAVVMLFLPNFLKDPSLSPDITIL